MNNKLTMQDFISQKIAVMFDSKKQEHEFLKLCAAMDLRWAGGKKADSISPFQIAEELASQVLVDYSHFDGLMFANVKYYVKHGYMIVPASDFLHDVPENRKYKIVIDCTDGKTTMARLFVDGKEVKQKMCRCHYTDKFRLSTGVKIAVERLFAKKEEREW